MSSKPSVLVARPIFEQTLERLREHFVLDTHRADEPLSAEALRERLQGKWGAFITGGERIDASVLDACPDLKIVANMAVGYNNLDMAALRQREVMATNTPDVLTESTADFGFALLLATARRITESEHWLRAGRWTQWRYDSFLGPDVHGATLGILGMGRIGQAIARRGVFGFGMKLMYHNRSRLSPEREERLQARYVSKAELLTSADHLVLVLPYSAQSHHAIGAAELAHMKPSATLVNVARGGIVDDAALAQALREGRLAAAGLDVFEGEPKVHPELLKLSNVVLTPHIASASLATRLAMADLAAQNLIHFAQTGQALTPIPD